MSMFWVWAECGPHVKFRIKNRIQETTPLASCIEGEEREYVLELLLRETPLETAAGLKNIIIYSYFFHYSREPANLNHKEAGRGEYAVVLRVIW